MTTTLLNLMQTDELAPALPETEAQLRFVQSAATDRSGVVSVRAEAQAAAEELFDRRAHVLAAGV